MWKPDSGTRELVQHFGPEKAFKLLTRLLVGEVSFKELTVTPYLEVIRFISNCDATTYFQGRPGERRCYWSRAWAARALAYLGDDDAADWLLMGLEDEHWRVRMTSAQTLGRLYIEGYEEALTKCLLDSHPRVRAAAAVTLGRTGNEFALTPLQDALGDETEEVRGSADRALAKVEKRTRQEK